MRLPLRPPCLVVLWLSLLAPLSAPWASRASAQPPPAEWIRQRNLGIAELENEDPAAAEVIFRQLAEKAPDDPLAPANLAIALLRQGKVEAASRWIERALATPSAAGARGSLLAIRGEIRLAANEVEKALEDFRRAAEASAEDVETLYALYRHGATFEGRSRRAAGDLAHALERLAELRPENLVVLLQQGIRAIEAEDRATASGAYLRIRELLWQGPPAAEALLGQVLEALESGRIEKARVPALRLETVLKPHPAYRGSQGELWTDIQGLPLLRFATEPPPEAFGDPVPIRFDGQRLSEAPGPDGTGLAVGDFDGDGRQDVARLVASSPPLLEVRLAESGWEERTLPAPPGLSGLLAADWQNRGHLDLLAFGPGGLHLWRGGTGGFEPAETPGLAVAAAATAPWHATTAVALDVDIEGDLDLFVAGEDELELLHNVIDRFESVGEQALPATSWRGIRDAAVTDLDRDGDLDLVIVHDEGLAWLDNLRQGRFRDRSGEAGLARIRGMRAVVSADLDGDGTLDLAAAGEGLRVWRGVDGRFEPWPLDVEATGPFDDLLAFDADNDGRLDLAAAGPAGVSLFGRTAIGSFRPLPTKNPPPTASALAALDLDDDGDLDLAATGPAGFFWMKNRGGHRNKSLQVRLRGLVEGNSKNNLNGLGAALELWAGAAYQFREMSGPVTHFGLGKLEDADLLRVVWTNGVPENRLSPKSNESLVEEQTLKGSCPFLYAWNGEGFGFVTDLLWGAPIGMPVAPGVWARPDAEELVKVEGLVSEDGVYRLRVTEELWEAAFFDYMRLWVVDHPEDVEVASSLRIVPGELVPDEVLASRGVRPVVAAWDGRGRRVTERIVERDEVYADGYVRSRYQGVAREPWTFTFDLGEAPGRPVRLHLDGWIFPADASLNLAIAQRESLTVAPPRLEVELESGEWEVLLPTMGFPAGKTKTLIVDTPALPPGARRLRIVTSQWLGWDRIAWSGEPVASPPVLAELAPSRAVLGFRGFSSPVRLAPNAPHHYDYAEVRSESPWLPLPGRYTRYGDVRELLASADSRSVILAPGDEMTLEFDGRHLPAVAPGWRRTLFLESHGWDKDADRNTYEGHRLEPLPFRGMSGYPWSAEESYPDTPELRRYRRDWLVREVGLEGPASSEWSADHSRPAER